MAAVTVKPATTTPSFERGDLISYQPHNRVVLVTAVNEDNSINGIILSDEPSKHQQLGTGEWVSSHDTSLYTLFKGTVTLEQ